MKIFITDKIDQINSKSKKYSYIYLFNSRTSFNQKKIISLVPLVEEEKLIKKKDFIQKINQFINHLNFQNKKDIDNEILNLVYLNNKLLEKNVYSSNFLFVYFQYIIFTKLYQKHSFKSELQIDLKDNILKSLIFSFKNNNSKNNKFSNFKLNLFSFFKGLAFQLINNINFKISFFKKKNKYDLLFIDHYNNYNSFNVSKIWSPLIKKLNFKNLISLAVNPPYLKKRNKNFMKITDFNSFLIFLKSFYYYFRIYIFLLFKIKKNYFKDPNYQILFNYYLNSFSGPLLMKLISDYLMYKKFFQNNDLKKIFYIYENQLWEYVMLLAAKNSSKNITTYAYAHTPIKYWDLRYDSSHSLLNYPLYFPDKICVSTNLCKNHFYDLHDTNDLIIVESLRYSNLINKPNINQSFIFKENQFVIFGDISKKSTLSLIELINLYAVQNQKFLNILIKFHPINKFKLNSYKYLKIKSLDFKESLSDKILLFPNYTTASIDYYYQGFLCFCYLDEKNFKLNSLFDYKDFKFFFHDIKTFNFLIKNISHRNVKTYPHEFYTSQSYNEWKRIAKC